MRVFLGVTGASGAPYAARLLESLANAGCEIGLAASAAGVEVIATELYGDASLPRADVLERFVGASSDQVTVYDTNDYKSPYASGSARVDAYVVCPCSMSTVGTLAAGAMANLIHRAASVALKERRKLVLVPRETPLSSIHLRGLCDVARGRGGDPARSPGFLPRCEDDRGSRGLHRRAHPRPDRHRQHPDAPLGTAVRRHPPGGDCADERQGRR